MKRMIQLALALLAIAAMLVGCAAPAALTSCDYLPSTVRKDHQRK